jgi:lysyl-tRNA synthetase class 2
MRSREIQTLRSTLSPNPYPHKFNVSRSLASFIATYGADGKIPAGTKLEGTTESLAGRIHNIRASSTKLRFYDLHGEGKKVQIMAAQQYVNLPYSLTFHSN